MRKAPYYKVACLNIYNATSNTCASNSTSGGGGDHLVLSTALRLLRRLQSEHPIITNAHTAILSSASLRVLSDPSLLTFELWKLMRDGVGVFSFLAEIALRSIRLGGRKSEKGGGLIILVAIVVTALAYFLSMLMRFGISRSREYMADAGAAEMTKNPQALDSALKKISTDHFIEAVQNRDVAQLFINNPTPSHHRASWDNLFSTHPPIEKRIEYLEQF